MRVCSVCKLEKPDSLFYKNSYIKPDSIRKYCNDCRNECRRRTHLKEPEINRAQGRKNYNKNQEKINAGAREKRKNDPLRFKGYCLKKSYGIGLVEYDELLKKQNGVCAICKHTETSIHHISKKLKFLAVDHDRKCCPTIDTCGKCIRGLLCTRCNTGIGKMRDDPELLRTAAEYIENKN